MDFFFFSREVSSGRGGWESHLGSISEERNSSLWEAPPPTESPEQAAPVRLPVPALLELGTARAFAQAPNAPALFINTDSNALACCGDQTR